MTLIEDVDRGTPARPGAAVVEVTIDSRTISVPEGTSVMHAASLAGIDIPKLCATDTLESFGSCRMCLVEVEGGKGVPASCTTPCSSGMVVRTESDKLTKLRQGTMELYMSDHPADCVDCEMHALADRVGLTHNRFGVAKHTHLHDVMDSSNPYFDFDSSKCIVCSRCVRACDEIQ